MDREKRPYKTHQVCFRIEVAFLLNVTNTRNKKTVDCYLGSFNPLCCGFLICKMGWQQYLPHRFS